MAETRAPRTRRSAKPDYAAARPPLRDLIQRRVRLSSDPNVSSLGARRVKVDTERLFAAGKGWSDLADVARDPQWIAAWTQRRAKCASAPLEIAAGGDDAWSLKARELVSRAFSALDLRAARERLLDCVPYGVSFAEVLWAQNGSEVLPVALYDAPAEWFVFSDEGVPLFLPDGRTPNELPPMRLLSCVHEGRADRPHGMKLLAVLYWLVYLKKHALKFQAVFLEKFSIPPIVARHPSGLGDTDLEALKAAVRAWSADVGIVVPNDVEIEIAKHQVSGDTPHQAVVRSCDAAIAKAVLGGSLTLESGSETGKGTQALGSVHADTLQALVDGDAALLEQAFNTLARWTCDLNLGAPPAGSRWPLVRIVLGEKRLDLERGRELREWTRLGLPVPLAYAREVAQVPAPEKGDELFAPAPVPGVAFSAPDDGALDGPPTALGDAAKAAFAGSVPGPIERAVSAVEAAKRAEQRAWMAQALEHGHDAAKRLRAEMDALLNQAADFDAARADLERHLSNLKVQEQMGAAWPGLNPALYDAVLLTRLYGRLLGREHVGAEIAAQLPSPSGRGAGGEGMSAAASRRAAPGSRTFSGWTSVAPEEAIRALKAKLAVSPEDWSALSAAEKAKAFGYSLAPSLDVTRAVKDALDQAVADGLSYDEFKTRVGDVYAAQGLTPLDDYRLQNIFQTNVMSAYNRGRMEQLDATPASLIPWYAYRTAGDEAVRPEHTALEGVYPRDDPFWDANRPPIDYRCRCSMQAVSAGRLAENGWTVRTDGSTIRAAREGFGRRNG